MKNIFLVFAFLSASFASKAQFSSASLTAAGLTCAMCTKAIFNSLEKLPMVNKVEADIKNSAFDITFKQGASPDPDVLKAAVESAGFSVAGLKLTGNFNHLAISNNAHVLIDGKIYHFMQVDQAVLEGKRTLTLVDKNYVTPKVFRKFSASSNYLCMTTGKTEECCPKAETTPNSRIYHVTL